MCEMMFVILQFMAEHNDIELVHTALRPLLLMLADFRNLNVSLLRVSVYNLYYDNVI